MMTLTYGTTVIVLPDPTIGEGRQFKNNVTIRYALDGTIKTTIKKGNDPCRYVMVFPLDSQDQWEDLKSFFTAAGAATFTATILGTTRNCKFATETLQREFTSHFNSTVRLDMEVI